MMVNVRAIIQLEVVQLVCVDASKCDVVDILLMYFG